MISLFKKEKKLDKKQYVSVSNNKKPFFYTCVK